MVKSRTYFKHDHADTRGPYFAHDAFIGAFNNDVPSARIDRKDLVLKRVIYAWNRLSLIFVVALLTILSATSPVKADDAWGGVRTFAADLSASNQTTVTNSDGAGLANVTFDINAKTITWRIEYSNLTSSITGVHIHGPARVGQNGDPLIDLGANGLGSPITGTVEISDSNAEYMMLGWTYVLLKTQQYPNGELRGKIDRVPPPEFVKGKSAEAP